MKANQQRLIDYLCHIRDAVLRIESYIAGIELPDFIQNTLIQDAVIRNFEVIGEASRNIVTRYPDFATSNPELPLMVAYEMRNALAHGYFQIDVAIVWNTVKRDLPKLKQQVGDILSATTMRD